MTTIRRCPPRGFTLLELVVVIGLLGLCFGLIFFKMDAFVPSSRIKSSSRELASRVEQARNYAIVSGLTIHFQYDIEQGRYRYYVPFELSEEDGKTIIGEGETVVFDWELLPDTIRIKDIIIGESDPIDSGIVTMTFEPRGVATGHIVHLTKEESEVVYSVVTRSILGLVDVVEGNLQPEVAGDNVF